MLVRGQVDFRSQGTTVNGRDLFQDSLSQPANTGSVTGGKGNWNQQGAVVRAASGQPLCTKWLVQTLIKTVSDVHEEWVCVTGL